MFIVKQLHWNLNLSDWLLNLKYLKFALIIFFEKSQTIDYRVCFLLLLNVFAAKTISVTTASSLATLLESALMLLFATTAGFLGNLLLYPPDFTFLLQKFQQNNDI